MGSHSCLDCGDITKKSHYNTGNYCHCPITASTSYPKFKVWFLILLAAAVLWHTVTKWPGSTFLPLYNYWHLFDYTLVFQVSTTCNLLTLSESLRSIIILYVLVLHKVLASFTLHVAGAAL